jgi:hypothetical protein
MQRRSRESFTISVDSDESPLRAALRFYRRSRRAGISRMHAIDAARSVFRRLKDHGYIVVPLDFTRARTDS